MASNKGSPKINGHPSFTIKRFILQVSGLKHTRACEGVQRKYHEKYMENVLAPRAEPTSCFIERRKAERETTRKNERLGRQPIEP